MDLFADPVLLSRLQFALTASYHFIFVPISIGIGLIMAIFVTKAFRSKLPEDEALSRMWVKIFTATFAIGVATGITMEFSFGTNWADYSRFVGDIFGAPLAAEALFAFFLESVFLGVLLFGRKKVSHLFYVVSSWLVWFGSCLSALWILIANSWMQTPAGAALSADGSEAIITEDPDAAALFCRCVDSAAVYVNASTRFTDGGEFGLGCEMGISTQKLHARGPMGLEELCTYKYIIHGNGQIR